VVIRVLQLPITLQVGFGIDLFHGLGTMYTGSVRASAA
jgi:hypothetical protein